MNIKKLYSALILSSTLLLDMEISKAEQIHDLEKRVEIVREIMECEGSDLYCQNAAKEFELQVLKTLREFATGKFEPHKFYSFGYLAQIGMPVEGMKIIAPIDLERIVDGFKTERWSAEFAKKFKEAPEFIMYSRKAAESDVNFSKGAAWVREYLIEKLSKRKHAARTATDYDEGYGQLNHVENQHILFLLKGYVDYFEGDEAKKQIPALFKEEFGGPEEGGLFFFNNRFEFIPFPNDARRRGKNENENYNNPAIHEYVPNLGLLHTHPVGNEEQVLSLTGPSGYAKYYPGIEAYYADTGLLRLMNHGNPYFIDIVVTKMGNGQYNVDAYFRDVYIKEGFIRLKPHITVIDLGVYEYKR